MAVVFLIEDDDFLRESLRAGLVEAGHDVHEASNGAAGLKLFDFNRPDVVITDIVMEDSEGIGMIVEVRKHHPDVPVIAISGNPLYLENSVKLGASKSLLKPFNMAVMLEAVGELLTLPEPKTA